MKSRYCRFVLMDVVLVMSRGLVGCGADNCRTVQRFFSVGNLVYVGMTFR